MTGLALALVGWSCSWVCSLIVKVRGCGSRGLGSEYRTLRRNLQQAPDSVYLLFSGWTFSHEQAAGFRGGLGTLGSAYLGVFSGSSWHSGPAILRRRKCGNKRVSSQHPRFSSSLLLLLPHTHPSRFLPPLKELKGLSKPGQKLAFLGGK